LLKNKERPPSIVRRTSVLRQLSVPDLFFSVIATALAALGSAAIAAEYRLDQQQSHLEQITTEVFDAKAEASPMFPEIDPEDDPYALRNLYTVYATPDDASESPWDMAYHLRDRGDFLRVEPDFEDVLVDPTARALFCSKSIDDESTEDPAWSLLAVNADQAWELTPRSAFRGGRSGLSSGHRLVRACGPGRSASRSRQRLRHPRRG
jgi:hypothetical protein